jgi:aryl-alcohol dehydrogenase-like predicted oxidoreductase
MKLLDQEIAPLGMGCWPIGGEMYAGEQSLGYTGADDATSIKTIHAALAGGVTLFDTAAAYGAGHSERLLARALKGRPDALIATKIGIGIDEETRQISFDPFLPNMVTPAVENCLKRLERDRIDMVLLHVNEMPIAEAESVFDELDRLQAAGKIRSYGWSTDYSQSAAAVASRSNFAAVEYAMNVFFDAPRMQTAAKNAGLVSLIRSPLAMGLLTGKYDAKTVIPANDIRASREDWMEYFRDGKANPDYIKTLDVVRELLTADGRTLVQGALGWLWSQGENVVPVPGARTVDQIEGIAAALRFGPIDPTSMAEIETHIHRISEEPDRPR